MRRAAHGATQTRRLIAVLAGATILSGAASAFAQKPRVRIDPDAPSAKEYAIPLEEARRRADPSRPPTAPIVQGSPSSPLFGEGITQAGAGADGGAARDVPRGERRGGSAARRGSSGRPRGDERSGDGPSLRPGGSEEPGRESNVVVEAVTQPGAPPDAGGSTALFLGGAGLVLGLGAAGGALLRRRLRR